MKQASKFDDEKTPFQLLPYAALTEVAEVFAFGAEKYGVQNWRKGEINWSRCSGSILRHILAWSAGQDNDPESGKSHLAHAAAQVLILLQFVRTASGTDDRFKELK